MNRTNKDRILPFLYSTLQTAIIQQNGNLIKELKRLGIYDQSLIIFSADHGEGMGGHDYYFAHGENLYQDVIEVPLIIRCGNGRTGRIGSRVQHIDIVPTILDTIALKQNLPYRGINLLAGRPHPRQKRNLFRIAGTGVQR